MVFSSDVFKVGLTNASLNGHFMFNRYAVADSAVAPAGSAGALRIVDSSNFPAAANIAMAHVTLKPGALRELHWHPNADEWQYYIQGSGRMTVFFNRATSRTTDFRAGDVGFVPQTLGHYVENTGDTDLVFLEMFKAPRFQDISPNDWLTHIPPELVIEHPGISQQTSLSFLAMTTLGAGTYKPAAASAVCWRSATPCSEKWSMASLNSR